MPNDLVRGNAHPIFVPLEDAPHRPGELHEDDDVDEYSAPGSLVIEDGARSLERGRRRESAHEYICVYADHSAADRPFDLSGDASGACRRIRSIVLQPILSTILVHLLGSRGAAIGLGSERDLSSLRPGGDGMKKHVALQREEKLDFASLRGLRLLPQAPRQRDLAIGPPPSVRYVGISASRVLPTESYYTFPITSPGTRTACRLPAMRHEPHRALWPGSKRVAVPAGMSSRNPLVFRARI